MCKQPEQPLERGLVRHVPRDELSMADILRAHLPAYLEKYQVAAHQGRVLKAIENCRTPQMGYHLRVCEACQHQAWLYNSCQNRHCPQCQWAAQAAWVERRLAELPRAKYHHTVFTVPDGVLYHLMRQNQKLLYTILFQAAAETLQTFAADPQHLGARIGMVGVLHTWGQTLNYHVHVHFLVTAGGLSPGGDRWVNAKYGDKFLFPVRALSQVFRGKFMAQLRQAYWRGELTLTGPLAHLQAPSAFAGYLQKLSGHTFRVHSRPATQQPANVVKYLGSYMRRIAISNRRLEELADGQVVFRYKDNRDHGKEKRCRTTAVEFIRRFVTHILPEGFVRVRYYGIFGGRTRKENLKKARALLGGLPEGAPPSPPDTSESDAPTCPACGVGKMRVVAYIRQPASLVWLLLVILSRRPQYVDTS